MAGARLRREEDPSGRVPVSSPTNVHTGGGERRLHCERLEQAGLVLPPFCPGLAAFRLAD
jgi:hypothetical protein